jgi:hypothetical protein
MGWRVLAGACACSIRRIWVDLLRKNLHEPLRTWISMSSTFRHTRTYAILWGAEPVEPGPQICQQSTGWCQVLFSIGSKRYIYISIYIYIYIIYISLYIHPESMAGKHHGALLLTTLNHGTLVHVSATGLQDFEFTILSPSLYPPLPVQQGFPA